MEPTPKPYCLTIAGSDSGGGAGIQADLKTFAANGVYGGSIITCTTAQTHIQVTDVHVLPLDHIAAQLDAVLSTYDIASVKTGMLFSAEIITLVAEKLREYRIKNIVVDPVMVARSGDMLIAPKAKRSYENVLFPLASVITPNRFEAEELLDMSRGSITHENAAACAKALYAKYAVPVLLKGIMRHGPPTSYDDVLVHASGIQWIVSSHQKTVHTHGTGCTLGAAITAQLAHDEPLSMAAKTAKLFLSRALISSCLFQINGSPVPVVNHAAR